MGLAELMAQLPAKPVAEMLDLLARCYALSDDPANPRLPLVILHLRSGRDLSGRIIKLEEDPRRARTLLVQTSGLGRAEDSALYVERDSIEAVTVVEADMYADLLSDGILPPPPSNVTPPSRLDVVRDANALAETLAGQRGLRLIPELEGGGVSGEAALSLSIQVKEAFAVLSDLAGDAMGKEALSVVKTLKIVNSASADVRLADHCLEISAVLAKGRAGRLSKADLKTRIAALF